MFDAVIRTFMLRRALPAVLLALALLSAGCSNPVPAAGPSTTPPGGSPAVPAAAAPDPASVAAGGSGMPLPTRR